ncbi:MAG: FtsX-like permease family protein, partial [Dorea sp.]
MKRAYWKDIWRTVVKEKKRFVSIAVIAALGVTMMCGLRASCVDLRYTADKYFDEQNLFDIRVLSTLGLTDEDVEALCELDEVKDGEGGFSETVHSKIDGISKSIEIRTLSEKEFNLPYLLEGELPTEENEIVITENYKNQSGNGVGDYIVLDEEPEYLKTEKYKITGIIVDTMDINSTEGSMGFRSTATTDYVGYVISEAADYDIYTAVYLVLDGTEELSCYTDEYEEKVEQVVKKIESRIKKQREQARYDEVYGEAMEEWLDGEQEMKEEFAKADKEIADAKKELADGKAELADARKQIENGKKQIEEGLALLNSKEELAKAEFAKAEQGIQSGYDQIDAGKAELKEAYQQLVSGQKELDAGKEELTKQQEAASVQFEQAHQQLAAAKEQITSGYTQAEQQVNALNQQIEKIQNQLNDPELSEEERAELKEMLAVFEEQLETAQKTLEETKLQMEAGLLQLQQQEEELAKQEEAANIQFEQAWVTIEESQAEIDAGFVKYEAGIKAMESAEKELVSGEKELEKQKAEAYQKIKEGREELEEGRLELLDGEKELADGEKELADGEKELEENIAEYEEEKAKAEKELADAKEKIDDIDMTKWYVQDRTALSAFTNVKSDADSIQAIGDIFPILFLTIAILISLTTITRMVDEERGLIGTYKALGFTNKEIRCKYVIYAAAACLLGGLVGDIGGYVILPNIIFVVFHEMYLLPEYIMQFDVLYGLGGI